MVGNLINFNESFELKNWDKSYDDLMHRFHDLYEECDKCLEKAYGLYGEILDISNEEDIRAIKIVHFIINARTERIIETGEKDEDVINFIRGHKNIPRDKYRKRQLEWMEAKALSLNSDKYLDSAIHIYVGLVEYFKTLSNNSKNSDEMIKQMQNLSCLKMELSSIYNKTNNKFLSKKLSLESIMTYIELYTEKHISKKELEDYYARFKKIAKVSCTIEEINKVDEIMNSNKIAL